MTACPRCGGLGFRRTSRWRLATGRLARILRRFGIHYEVARKRNCTCKGETI